MKWVIFYFTVHIIYIFILVNVSDIKLKTWLIENFMIMYPNISTKYMRTTYPWAKPVRTKFNVNGSDLFFNNQ